MAMSDFTIISRSLSSRLFSTVTTALTVAVAVGLMLTLLSLREAGRDAFSRGGGNMEILISRDASPMASVLNAVFYAGAPPRAIEWRKFEEIRDGFPFEFAIPVQQGDSYRGFPVMATKPEFFREYRPGLRDEWTVERGRIFESPFEVVLGSRVAEATGLNPGDRIFLTHGAADSPDAHVHYDFDYRVVGVLGRTGTSHDRALFTDLVSSWIIHAHDVRQNADPSVTTTTEADLTDADRQITGIYARTAGRPGAEVSAAWQMVFNRLRADPTLTVAAPGREMERLLSIVGEIDSIFIAMAIVVLVSSGIAIMLALYNSMEQRRRQIAVLRVLGCSRPRIFGLIVTESAILGLLGVAGGLVIYFIGAGLVAGAMRQRLGLVINPVLDPQWTLAVVAGTVLLASLAGVVPALMAYRTPVAKNLRPLG
ncbi:MAG: ABC transporter permease [Phycisphaeraceae bacterium]|nr:MAG: ABC transporter permease [Phycisphaeraceae bacterium]